MARIRYVKGKVTELIHGDINYISESAIVDNAMFVNHNGGENGIFYGNENSNTIDNIIIDSYWTDLNDNKITKAILGETVKFHIKTHNVPNNTNFLVRVYEWSRINDTKLGTIKAITIIDNKGYFEIYLNKKAWKNLLKSTGEGKELELFCKVHCWGSSIEKGKYLKVENKDKAIAFFIGGAADKESYYFQGAFNNIQDAQKVFEKELYKTLNASKYYSSYYLDYSDTFDAIEKEITSNIFDKDIPIYIIGHSLGGWNGAHLSQILTDLGYKIGMLITLDPVGEGFIVYLGSDIYREKPKPKADFWINLKATPSKPDQSDDVAEFGERWNVKSGPNIKNNANLNHYDAKGMLMINLSTGKSASQYLLDAITSLINQ